MTGMTEPDLADLDVRIAALRGVRPHGRTVKHVILDRPLRCWLQMVTAMKLEAYHGALAHLTEGCAGKSTGRRPGMGSGCMPPTERGYDRCRHDLDELRAEGAIEIMSNIVCWPPDGRICRTCRGREWHADGAMWVPDEYPSVK